MNPPQGFVMVEVHQGTRHCSPSAFQTHSRCRSAFPVLRSVAHRILGDSGNGPTLSLDRPPKPVWNCWPFNAIPMENNLYLSFPSHPCVLRSHDRPTEEYLRPPESEPLPLSASSTQSL